jgi:hypothetical protein
MRPTEEHSNRAKSERVVLLTASCIQSIARLRHGAEIPTRNAIALARVHDVRSASEVIATKLDLMRAVPEAIRLPLVVAEAQLETGTYDKSHIDALLRARRASVQVIDNTRGLAPRHEVVAALQRIRKEWSEWGDRYLAFVRSLGHIHASATQELGQIRLSSELLKRAETELERIALGAIRKASECESSKKAAA